MRKLKNIVKSNIRKLTVIIMTVILVLTVFFQFISAHNQAQDNAKTTFAQVEQIIEKNQSELVAIEADYRETCLLNAETISYIIECNPDILGDVAEFLKLAKKMQVDEIHIFDDTGRIFTGTHPQYYNFTFDSGEQMNFFKPMLEDKTLKLCQDITPNTAEAKLVQYSALWSGDGKYIIQVGMYPEAVLETTKKNELSYIFSLLKGNPGVSLYAIDSESGVVVGSTSGLDNGRKYGDMGFPAMDMNDPLKPSHHQINGINSYCIFKNVNGTLIAYVIASSKMYANIFSYTAILALCLMLIAIVLIFAVQKFTDSYIISSISGINAKLRAVTGGEMDERVEIETSVEFSELSSHINHMIGSLLSNSDKMSFILKSANMLVGVYEYNPETKRVSFTEHIPKILGLDENTMKELSSNCEATREYIENIKRNPVYHMEKTYAVGSDTERYIKLEEMVKGNDILGILIDVTDDIVSLKRAEEERDMDILTGIYNRRGMERLFDRLFYKQYEELGSGVLIIIDLDDMKHVNDTYGHALGDKYLQCFAKLLRDFESPHHVAARIGGDEFVLFAYGYKDDEAAFAVQSKLRQMQDNTVVTLSDGIDIKLRFSFGYRLLDGSKDYNLLLISADEYMYNSKRTRKKIAAENTEKEI